MELNNISINRLVPYFLMSSYLYYVHNKSVLTDNQFDNLCKRLDDNWDNITHVHKELISRQDLKVGSGYAINYTNMIMNSALKWYETETKKGETK
tara:strand:- start:684 stop:968 length:285 start_codon:yes stop_codon:yes gene_type:complete